jgi:uncharacterized protein YbaA (DUF1428 family)
MNYVDGFVVAVPTANRDAYRRQAENGAAVFKDHGALSVVFSCITWPSRAARDEGMKQSMDDPRLKNAVMTFDGHRMIYGGFEVIVSA